MKTSAKFYFLIVIEIFICFLFLCGCISCNNSCKVVAGPPYTIFWEKEIDNIQLTNLTEIGSTITYVPLETSEKSLLGDFLQIKASNSFITVSDNQCNVLMFDDSGVFLRQITRKGRGPGEVSLLVWDYCFSLDGEKIYILIENNRCLEYDVEGRFLDSYKLDSIPSQMLPLRENLFVFYTKNTPTNPVKQSLIISDLNNNIQKTFRNHNKRINIPYIGTPGVPFYSYQGEIRFKELGSDTLFTVFEEELIPYAVLSLGKKKMNLDIPVNPGMSDNPLEQEGKIWVRDVFEDVDNIYIGFMKHDFHNMLFGYYNKQSNGVKVIGEDGFQNNIDGGLPFFPKFVYDDNILVSWVTAFDLREHVLNGNVSEKRRLYGQKYDDLVKLANSLDDQSNPVVVIVKK